MRMATWSPATKPSWRSRAAKRLERSLISRYDRTSPLAPMMTAGASGRSLARVARSSGKPGSGISVMVHPREQILADPLLTPPHRPVRNPLAGRIGIREDDPVVEDFERCYRAVTARDARFDGWFVTAVSSTHIYCRPSCPARTPRRLHV